MSQEELKFPEWQGPLQDVILEFDRERMLQKVQDVEALIFERLRQLSVTTGSRVEHDALNDALSVLRILKRERLGDTRIGSDRPSLGFTTANT
jgi:hypothetical protein